MKIILSTLGTLGGSVLLSGCFNIAIAQSPSRHLPVASATISLPAFELADVHPSSRKKATGMSGGYLDGDRFIIHHATMAELVSKAYGVPSRKVLGGPFWVVNDRYDIIAKAPPDTSDEVIAGMLRSLLVDRFKLVVHTESRPLPAYMLTAPHGSFKMKQSNGSSTPGCKSQQTPDGEPTPGTPIAFSCRGESMAAFANFLYEIMWNPNQRAIDATGLKGLWDFDFKALYPPRTSVECAQNFGALENQLGLKIEGGTAPLPILIVDSVNQVPTPNPPGIAALLPSPSPTTFSVATIQPSSSNTKDPAGHIGNGQIDLTGTTMQFLINFAFDLTDQTIANPPKWLDQDKFDILAKITPTNTAAGAVTIQPFDDEDLPQMVRKLLEDRFGLKWHMEDRPADAYALLAVNPKLRKADALYHRGCQEGPPPDGTDPRINKPILGRLISCQNMTMAQFAHELPTRSTGYIKIPVFDATGLTGTYDFVLSFSGYSQVGGINEWSLVRPPPGAPSATHLVVPPGGLLLFDAIEQQLGLKLEKQKHPTPMLVIDHIVEKPKAN